MKSRCFALLFFLLATQIAHAEWLYCKFENRIVPLPLEIYNWATGCAVNIQRMHGDATVDLGQIPKDSPLRENMKRLKGCLKAGREVTYHSYFWGQRYNDYYEVKLNPNLENASFWHFRTPKYSVNYRSPGIDERLESGQCYWK